VPEAGAQIAGLGSMLKKVGAARVFLTMLAKNCWRLLPAVALAWAALWNGVPSMPITARLSHKLHQTLGDDAAEDLVNWIQQVDAHRAELRDLNELYLSRIDARFAEARGAGRADVAELRQEMQAGFATLRQELQAGLRSLETKLEQRTAELMKWSFVFWVGAVGAIAVLAGVLR
jgi:hypothetical protein